VITELYYNKDTGQFWSKETGDKFITTNQVEMVMHVKEQNSIPLLDARDFVESIRLYYGGEPRIAPTKSARAGKVSITKLFYSVATKQFWAEETGDKFITIESMEMAKHVVYHNGVSLQEACKLVLNARSKYTGESEAYPCK